MTRVICVLMSLVSLMVNERQSCSSGVPDMGFQAVLRKGRPSEKCRTGLSFWSAWGNLLVFG